MSMLDIDPWATPWTDPNPLVTPRHQPTRSEQATVRRQSQPGAMDRVQCPCCGGVGIKVEQPHAFSETPYGEERRCELNCDDHGEVPRWWAEEWEYKQRWRK